MSAPLCSSLDDNGLELLETMLVYDPAGRISAKQACNHPYFEDYPMLYDHLVNMSGAADGGYPDVASPLVDQVGGGMRRY